MNELNLEDILKSPRSACEEEPIHQAAGIHPDVYLVIVNPNNHEIRACSQNLLKDYNFSEKIIGKPVTEIFPEIQEIFETLKVNEFSSYTIGILRLKNQLHDVVLHRQDFNLLVELFPQSKPGKKSEILQTSTQLNNFTQATRRLSLLDDFINIPQLAAEELRTLTGYDRVLIYKFDKDGHGQVIAENVSEKWEQSFKGFFFPESDIPAQARALYQKSVLRYHPNREYDPAPLYPAIDEATNAPFDIGLAWARSQSPIHLAYQKNLGVDGALSISIMDGKRLWGLIVGHKKSSHHLSALSLSLAVNLTEVYFTRYIRELHVKEYEKQLDHIHRHALLLEQLSGADNMLESIFAGEITLRDLFDDCESAAIVFPSEDKSLESISIGNAPPEKTILDLAKWFQESQIDKGNTLYASDCLSDILTGFRCHAKIASGALICAVGEKKDNFMIWFRPEVIQKTDWGGNPAHLKEHEDGQPVLPRLSFDRWTEIKRRHSVFWSDWEMSVASSMQNAINNLILRQHRTIRHLNAELKRSNRVKTDFMANMSHELRTPLNAIIGFSSSVKQQIFGPVGNQKYLEYIEDIENAGQHLLQIVNDILDVSAIEAEKLEISETWCEIDDLIKASIDLVKGRAHKKSVTIKCELKRVHSQLYVDSRRLKQVLINLLSNAVKFSPEFSTTTLSDQVTQDGSYRLIISDAGIGMSEDDIIKSMAPFGQVIDGFQISHEGTGLGLPLSRHLIEIHDGELIVDSQKGRGTTITIHIPKERFQSE